MTHGRIQYYFILDIAKLEPNPLEVFHEKLTNNYYATHIQINFKI